MTRLDASMPAWNGAGAEAEPVDLCKLYILLLRCLLLLPPSSFPTSAGKSVKPRIACMNGCLIAAMIAWRSTNASEPHRLLESTCITQPVRYRLCRSPSPAQTAHFSFSAPHSAHTTPQPPYSERRKALLAACARRDDAQHVEAHRLGQRPARTAQLSLDVATQANTCRGEHYALLLVCRC